MASQSEKSLFYYIFRFFLGVTETNELLFRSPVSVSKSLHRHENNFDIKLIEAFRVAGTQSVLEEMKHLFKFICPFPLVSVAALSSTTQHAMPSSAPSSVLILGSFYLPCCMWDTTWNWFKLIEIYLMWLYYLFSYIYLSRSTQQILKSSIYGWNHFLSFIQALGILDIFLFLTSRVFSVKTLRSPRTVEFSWL